MDKFLEKVNKTDSCWLWTGARLKIKGQKWHGVLRRNKQYWLTHRYSWTMFNGEIPTDMFVLHRCDVPNCVNPDHLFLGTQDDNIKDMMNKGRHADQRGILQSNVKLTEEQVRYIKNKLDISTNELAEQYKVSPSTIRDIKKNRTWTHI
jgi:hypothetical protein